MERKPSVERNPSVQGSVDTLSAVHLHVSKSKTERIFGPIGAYITGFDAATPHPFRFMYHGCSHVSRQGRHCRKAIKGPSPCGHSALTPGEKWQKMYRFDIFLAGDGLGPACPPLRAGIFEDAITLLGVHPDVLDLLSEPAQHLHVHDCINKNLWVEVALRCKEGIVTVHEMKFNVRVTLPMNPSWATVAATRRTPKRKHGSERKSTTQGPSTSQWSPSTMGTPPWLRNTQSPFNTPTSVFGAGSPRCSATPTSSPWQGRRDSLRANLADLPTWIHDPKPPSDDLVEVINLSQDSD